MASSGIRDRVTIIAMGCTRFGERWDKSVDDLLIDATTEAVAGVPGIELSDIDAFWLGTVGSGISGLTLSGPLKDYKPVTQVENFCATGPEAFRNACYAVASGAYDVAMAVGVEKLKDIGYSGLVTPTVPGDGTAVPITAPASFSYIPGAYCAKFGIAPEDFKQAMARVAWKNQATVPAIVVRSSRTRCRSRRFSTARGSRATWACTTVRGGSDGAAAAVIVRAENAHRYTDKPL
jgi:acetyl-CoA C-acetyltransferase